MQLMPHLEGGLVSGCSHDMTTKLLAPTEN